MKKNIFYIFSILLLTACVQEPVENGLGGYVSDEEYQKQFIDTDEEELVKEIANIDTVKIDISFIDFTNNIIDLLDQKNYYDFASQFHPTKGCRFVPYTFGTDDDQIFNGSRFNKKFETEEKLNWGLADGSGEPILISLPNYLNEWVYDFDFKNKTTEVHIDEDLAFSNTLNNMSELYPNAKVIEFYNEGTDEFTGMDWKSLIFYAEKVENTYYLVAVVHNEWTI